MPAFLRSSTLTMLLFAALRALPSEGRDEGYLSPQAEGNLYDVRPAAYQAWGGGRVDWGPRTGSEKTISMILSPDGIYGVFRSGHMAASDQLRYGQVTFIDAEMPLDFVMMIRPLNYDLTLYAGGDSKPFTEYLSAHVWYGGDGPDGQGVSLRVLGVGIPERFIGWKRAIAAKKSVVLRSEEGVVVRVRASLKKNVWTETKSPDGREDVRHLALSIRCALGEIPGNEELRDFLNSRHGRPPVVATQMVNFEFIRRKDVDKELELNYQMWRIRSAQPPKTPESQKEIIDAYEKILQVEPNHEVTLLTFAAYLEEVGLVKEAIETVRMLISAVQAVPRSRDPIEAIEPFSQKLQQPTKWCSQQGSSPLPPEQVVGELKRHIDRLQRLQEGKKP